MAKPSFIIIGAERCGTTSLYCNIIKHSQISPAKKKEIEFFDRYYDNGIEWYESQLGDYITGEATPTYFWNPQAPQRIKKHYPNTKIIFISRDPVEACYSKYWQQVAKGVETLSFADAINSEPQRIKDELTKATISNYYPSNYVEFAYLDRYRYEKHLQNWSRFDVLALQFASLRDTPDLVMDQVFDFLDLDYESHAWQRENQGINYPKMDADLYDLVKARIANNV